jgi:signal peptidase II
MARKPRRTFVKANIILIFCIVIDFFAKKYYSDLQDVSYNSGLFLGIYSDIEQNLKVLVLSTFSGFLFSFYLFFAYLIPNALYFLKYGLALLMGGIFGNVLDQIMYGRTYDFIPVKLLGNFYANTADIFQWLGFLIIVISFFKREDEIWHPMALRKKLFIKPKEQLKFSFKMTAVAFAACLLLGLFSLTFLKGYYPEGPLKQQTIVIFVISYFFMSMIFNLLVFISGIIIAHKTAGPLYAFELYVLDLLNGSREDLVLRDGDNYRHFEKIALKLKRKFIEFDKK